jgi:ABC-type molybdate transport system substrate-binding protein
VVENSATGRGVRNDPASPTRQSHRRAPRVPCQAGVYPVGILTDCKNPEEAKLFVEFLQSEEAMAIFETAGFASNLS